MDSTTYLNRELSWLEFNRRVLEEARDENVPLLERVKFLAIFSSNLDEFFMVRVARLKRQIRDGIESIGPDGLTHTEALTAISRRVHELAEEQHLCFLNTILPQLTGEDIHLVRPEEMSREQERFLKEFFHRTLYPIVTPLAIDPGHPFSYLANRSLCLVVTLQASGVSDPAIIEELYVASQAGVHIDLIVRGMCNLRPGVPGTSEHIRVLSIVDRYLEHARIFYFQNGGNPTCWLVSADWMQRNFDRRVEIAFPVIDLQLQAKLRQVLEILGDTVKGWWMQPDGTYVRTRNDGLSSIRCQEQLYEIIRSENGTPPATRGRL